MVRLLASDADAHFFVSSNFDSVIYACYLYRLLYKCGDVLTLFYSETYIHLLLSTLDFSVSFLAVLGRVVFL